MRGSGLVHGCATMTHPNHSMFSAFCANTYLARKTILTQNTATQTVMVAFLSVMECLLSGGGLVYTPTHSRGNASIFYHIQQHLGSPKELYYLLLYTNKNHVFEELICSLYTPVRL